METILGAGGAIGAELVKELARAGRPVRLVGRRPVRVEGATEIFAADLPTSYARGIHHTAAPYALPAS